jgi:4,5-dihydroxyphthalate decarboxylase
VTERLRLSMGMGDYDHVRDLASGVVRMEGLDLLPLDLPVEEIFYRFLNHREWDVSEISMAKYSAMVSRGDTSVVAIPVFPSRMFRHSSIYVRAHSGIEDVAQLRGRRVGLPEWAQTAAVYSRALLVHEYGVPLTDVTWFQAGVNQPGRKEKVALSLPDGVSYTSVPDRSLGEMLLAGDLDAVFSAHPPSCYGDGTGDIVRLVRDHAAVEQEYFARTGIFPIMHAVALRREVVEQHPWVPSTLYKGFEQAKRRSLERFQDVTISRFPLPWLQSALRDGAQDPWPYGVEANRTTLDAFLGFAHEQGVTQRRLRPEELFAPSVDEGFRI